MTYKRSPCIEKKYVAYRKQVLVRYNSLDDYLKCKVLKYGWFIDNKGKRHALLNDSSLQYAIVRNKFPYDLPEKVQHWVLWSQHPRRLATIDKLVRQQFGKDVVFERFVNDTTTRSVSNLWHAHILVRQI
jgi:hypothetical protein